MESVKLAPDLQPWAGTFGAAEAAHLLRRAGFGGHRSSVERAVRVGLNATVDSLLAFDADEDRDFRRDLTPILEAADIETLAGWWLYRMRFATSALREKLTLFWHGHFATSQDKVQNVKAMAGHLFLLLDHAAGSFADLVHAMVRDPALLIWLDGADSDVQHPNENLARELFELFTLGRGNYQEQDVLEAARALTGATLRRGVYQFDADRHDGGEKSVLGTKSRMDARGVVDAALTHPACARHVAASLLRFFVEPEPAEEAVESLADGLRRSDYSIAWALGVVFRSRLFYQGRVRRALVKSPLELVVGLLQALDASGNFKELERAAGRMGQSLLRPPSVRGWKGGMAWMNAATVHERHSFAARLLEGQYGEPLARSDLSEAQSLIEALGLDDLPKPGCDVVHRAASGARLQVAAALPEYQLN